MATPEHPDFDFDESPQLFLFTSLTAGSSHIITATSRMETILKANRIPFRVVDIATTDKARQLWSRRSRDKKIPGLVKEGMVLGDLTIVEEWNEYGEIKMHLADAKGPTPHYVQAAPEISSAQETKQREAENDKASIKSGLSTTSSQHQAQSQLAVEAAAAAAARKNNKSPLPILQKAAASAPKTNDDETEQNTLKNETAQTPQTPLAGEKTPTVEKSDEESVVKTTPVPLKTAHDDEELDEVKTLSEEEIASSPHSPKPLQTRSVSRTSNSVRPGEGDDFEPQKESTSHATIAHPALSAVASGSSLDAPAATNIGRASMLRQAQDELEAALRGDEAETPETEKEAKSVASIDGSAAAPAAVSDSDAATPVHETPKQTLQKAPPVPSKDDSAKPHIEAEAAGRDKELPQAPAAQSSNAPATGLAEKSGQNETVSSDEKAEAMAAKKASVSAKDGTAATDSVED